MESEEVLLETEEISIESDDDEDDIIGLNLFDIHDIRSLTAEESNLDPRLNKLLDDFGQLHSYLHDAVPCWTYEDHMALIEKKMTECQLKLDIDYYGCTVKDGTHPVVHRPPIEDVVFFRNTRNADQPIIGVLRGDAELQFNDYPYWKECHASIYLKGNSIPKNILGGEMDDEASNQKLDLPPKFNGTEYKFVKDAIVLFEVGRAEIMISPAYTWDTRTRSSKNWTVNDNDNFNNFIKVYCYIQEKFEEMHLTATTVIKKKAWRDDAKNLFGGKPDYFKIAVERMKSRPLLQVVVVDTCI